MKRRSFIQNTTSFASGLILTGLNFSCGSNNSKTIKFAISADIHKGGIPDADERLQSYLSQVENLDLDFLIELGDFCHAVPENVSFVKTWNDFPAEKYHVLGNHDMDFVSKEDYMDFVGMKNRYYSFDKGDFHFIVLDVNTLNVDGKFIPYSKANFYKPLTQRAYVDPEQIEWLKKDISETEKNCIIFSHQSFENPKACQNQAQIREIFERENEKAGYNKVVAAFSGHNHTDYAKDINGINYVQINSMCGSYVGAKYHSTERYSEEINKQFPGIKNTCPYIDALFAVVTIKGGEITIDGIESSFIKPTPKEVGLNDGLVHGLPLAAKISDRTILYDNK